MWNPTAKVDIALLGGDSCQRLLSLSLSLAATLLSLMLFVSLHHSSVSSYKAAFLIACCCAHEEIELLVHPSVTL